MENIKIGTLNTQNSKINRTGGVNGRLDNSKILASHIEQEGYYLLGTQELTRVFSKKLLNNLKKYKLFGGYRYGSSKIVKKIKFLEDFNENNSIITNQPVVREKTKMLPWVPNNPKDLLTSIIKGSIMPRIATIITIDDPKIGKIYAINTHLDYQLSSVQMRQLKNLLKMIRDISFEYKIIITGDFNMEIGNPIFDSFVKELSDIGLKRISVNDKTNAEKFPNKTAIDHIFIPKNWEVTKSGIIENKNLEQVTDHKGVYADIRIITKEDLELAKRNCEQKRTKGSMIYYIKLLKRTGMNDEEILKQLDLDFSKEANHERGYTK